ncbi:MAG: c-type cytochrome [Gemmatimonadota bacterium]
MRHTRATFLAVGTLVGAAACASGKPAPPAEAAQPVAPTGQFTAPPSVRYDQHVFAGGAVPPAGTLDNPFAADPKSATEGEKLFSSMNCNGCHATGATGAWAPSLSDGRWRYGGADGAIYQSIFYGRPEGMPAFGGMLQPPVIWKLVTYLKSLPVPRAVPTQSW